MLFGSTSEDVSDHAPPFSSLSLTSVDGDSFASGGKNAKGSDDRTSIEGGIRFKRDFELDENSSLTLVLSPFLVFSEEDVNASVTGGCCNVRRDGDVDTWLGGGLVAVEPETWITAGMALVGRAGVGLYGFSSEGSFSSRSTQFRPGPRSVWGACNRLELRRRISRAARCRREVQGRGQWIFGAFWRGRLLFSRGNRQTPEQSCCDIATG